MSDATESLRAELNDMASICDLELRDDDAKLMRKAASALERLETAERLIGDLRGTIDAMMRECGSEPSSRYAKNACIIGAAALAREEMPNDTPDARSGQKSPVGKNG